MPRLTVVTSALLDGEQVAALSDKLSAAVAEMLAKPLQVRAPHQFPPPGHEPLRTL